MHFIANSVLNKAKIQIEYDLSVSPFSGAYSLYVHTMNEGPTILNKGKHTSDSEM